MERFDEANKMSAFDNILQWKVQPTSKKVMCKKIIIIILCLCEELDFSWF